MKIIAVQKKEGARETNSPTSLVVGKDRSKRIIHFWPDGTTKIHRYDAACMCEINYILDRTRDK